MKIIAGERKGHVLTTVNGLKTRPTLSRVRESLFSIIAGDVPDSLFCELFAGTGSIGLEALSRGARRAIFVEAARDPQQCLRQNIGKLHYTDRAEVVNGDVYKWSIPTGNQAPDIIYADPPYDAALIEKLVHKLEKSQLESGTLVILQTPAHFQLSTTMQHLRTAKYGSTALHFLLPANPETTDHSATDSR